MRIIHKDITTVERGVLINGVNCQRAMGSGVAKAYYTKWPQVREEYMKSEMVLGNFEPVTIIENELYVANCWTQEFYGRDGKKYADTSSIYHSVFDATTFAQDLSLPLYTPWVGCGLGGISKVEVFSLLEDIEKFTNVDITICQLEGE